MHLGVLHDFQPLALTLELVPALLRWLAQCTHFSCLLSCWIAPQMRWTTRTQTSLGQQSSCTACSRQGQMEHDLCSRSLHSSQHQSYSIPTDLSTTLHIVHIQPDSFSSLERARL